IREGGYNYEMLTQEYVRKITEEASDDDHFTRGPWLSAVQYLAVEGSIATGCFGDMKTFIKNRKVEKVVAVIKSCAPNMLGDLTVTLKDLSGIISGTIHYKVLNDEGIAAPNESQTLVLMQEDQISSVPILDAIDAKSILEKTHIKDAQEESNNDVLMSTNDRETTKEVVDELVSSDKSITNEEHKDGSRNFKYLHHEIYVEVVELEDLRMPFDEIKFVARFQKHPNVVALIEFYEEQRNEIILVYEYVKSRNLADKMSKHLNTIQRLEICLDAARGLEYLHTGVDKSTPEALETYAKISCRSVIKNPEEYPTMTGVVIKLEKAFRLQGGEVSSIHILGGCVGNGLTKETVIEVDQPEDDKPEEKSKVVEETIVDDKPEEESKVVDETIAPDETEESKVIEQNAKDIEDAKKENGESAEEITVDTKPKEEPTQYTPITTKTAEAKGKVLKDGNSNKLRLKRS
nr:hypothetical protein [Tanacetum cinerariifolium]GEX32992.1 hypothetical protein [Tanacetum cinerariifolium]